MARDAASRASSRRPPWSTARWTSRPGVRLRVGPGRADHGRVLPRRPEPGRAALHRQHLPVRPGRLGGLDPARPHAVGGGLPAHPGRRDGRAAGADHLDPGPVDHLAAGRLRARPTTTPTRRRSPPSPTSTPPPSCPARSPRSASTRRSTRWPRRRTSWPPRSWASATTTVARQVQEVLQRYQELQDIIAILGLDELSEEDRVTVSPGPQDPALPVPAVLRGRGLHRR